MTRRLFGTLCGLVFFVNFGRVAFAPLVEPLQAAFGVGPAAIGTVTTLVWVGSAVPRLPAGYLLTRVPREWVVVGTGVLLTVAAAATSTANSLTALRVGGFVIGLASGVYFVAAIPLVGELMPGQRGRAVGIHGTASQLASVLAPAAVVVLLVVDTWRATFWLLAVAAGLSTLSLALLIRRRPESVPSPPAGQREFTAALSHWRVILAGIAFVVAVFLVLLDFHRRLLYLVGIPFVGIQVVLYFVLNWPDVLNPGGIGDKVVQVTLIAILFVLYRRESEA